jgi:hypothetical protein
MGFFNNNNNNNNKGGGDPVIYGSNINYKIIMSTFFLKGLFSRSSQGSLISL